jgi:hypothetical protein
MAGEGKSVAESLESLGSAITSPAKLAFVGYVILVATEKICSSRWEFLVVAIGFFMLQVYHDDYVRIRLNECARLKADKARRAEFPEPGKSSENIS